MKRSLLCFLLAFLCCHSHTVDAAKPNILFIFTDDQSFRTVSCYPEAYNYAITPNIDRLAAQGIRFQQAYIGAKCVPSRAGMLTGRFQYACAEGPQYKWWTTALRAKGYYTGMIGKWHWGKGAEAHQHGTAWDWSVVWDHGQYDAAGGYYYDQKVMINGGKPQDLEGYSTDRYTDYTVDFIKERARNPKQPWFHWVAYGAVHGPYTPAERHQGMHAAKPKTAVPEDIYGPRPEKPVHMQGSLWKKGPDGEPLHHGKTLDFWAKQQTEAVAAIDEGVGRMIQALEETSQLEDTIIVFTSDQGYVWGHHGLKGKIWPYAAAIRSPLIISNPKRYPAGSVCKVPVNGMDLVRTFHAMAGVMPDQVLHGRDMTPVLEAPESAAVAAEWNQTPTMMTYTQNTYTAAEMAKKLKAEQWPTIHVGNKVKGAVVKDAVHPCYFLILDGEYKYIRYTFPDRIEELYNLAADPDELNNLSLKSAHQKKLLEMRSELVAYLRKTGGEDFVDLLPAPKSAEQHFKKTAITANGDEKKGTPSAILTDHPGNTPVYHQEGAGRVHLDGCKRLTNDPAERAKLTRMTLAEAKSKGLTPCSRCSGSATPGKGKPEGSGD
jgi:arylsulfatase A-like enzyme